MKKWSFVSLLVIAALLIAAVPAFADGPPDIYWDISEDGMNAWLIHDDIDIQVYAYYAEDCYGQVYKDANLEPPWHNIRWITIPEDGEGPLGYIGAYISYQVGDGWSEPFWVDGNRQCSPPVEVPSCPSCGEPLWESASGPQGDGLAMVWYSPEPCNVCYVEGEYFVELGEPRVRAWSTIPFSFEYPATVFHEAEAVQGADGVTYYTLDVDAHTADNAIIWGPNGSGDRFRDYGPVYKYSSCSVAPGYYDAPDGVAIYKPGHTVADWAQFLLDNGFFADEMYPGDAALAWANQLHDAGELALP